jgi:hypothetical protein
LKVALAEAAASFGISFEFFSQEFQFLDVLGHRLPVLSQIKKFRAPFVI